MTSARRAAFLAVGSELLRTERVDTNSVLALPVLRRAGYSFSEKRAVGDDVDDIAHAAAELVERNELVLISGGLGPTADDVTREAIAQALGRALIRDETIVERLRERYQLRNRPFPAVAARMADVIEGAVVLHSSFGAAPGQILATEKCTVVLLPGVPRELEDLLTTQVAPRLAGDAVLTRTLRLGGVYESLIEDRVSHLYERFGRERITILAGKAQVFLVLSADGVKAVAELAEMERAFRELAGADLYGVEDDTLASVSIAGLRARGLRLATAESCTGGLIGELLTAVPGASDVYAGGVVTYSNELKTRLLGVSPELIAARGAVSREVAAAMANGALALGAECAVAVTGIAGPTGGSDAKPVGTVHMAVATPAGLAFAHQRFQGDRVTIREFAANFALDLLRRQLELTGDCGPWSGLRPPTTQSKEG